LEKRASEQLFRDQEMERRDEEQKRRDAAKLALVIN
jgi:hypothetical protein